MERIYPSKVLLVGEYTVLMGHPGLAIPYSGKYAQWDQSINQQNETLFAFHNFLKNSPSLKNCILFESFHAFISEGGYLKSNIPYGYGLGSSGSLCAAVLDRFGAIGPLDIQTIFKSLQEMEHYFHGQSSGLDPIVSFFNQSVFLENGGMQLMDLAHQNIFAEFSLHLIDSKIKRNTLDLISIFNHLCKNEEFVLKINQELVPANKQLIRSIQNHSRSEFQEHWISISSLSLVLFKDMIPENIFSFWENGLHSGAYYCKLCGAGGGGLFLGMVQDEIEFKKQIRAYSLELFV